METVIAIILIVTAFVAGLPFEINIVSSWIEETKEAINHLKETIKKKPCTGGKRADEISEKV